MHDYLKKVIESEMEEEEMKLNKEIESYKLNYL